MTPDLVRADRLSSIINISGSIVRVNVNVPQIARAVYRCVLCSELQEAKFVFLDDYRVP